MTGTQTVLAAEALIEKYQAAGGGEMSLDEVHAAVKEALVALSGVEAGQTVDLAGTIDAMLNLPKLDRDALLFTARLLDVHGLLPDDANSGIYFQRRFTAAFERILPDISKLLGLANSKQTVDKIQVLRGLHGRASQTLEVIAQVPATTSGFLASKQSIFQALNNQLLKAYFRPYCYTEQAAFIREMFNSVGELLECIDATFILKMEACEQTLSDAWESDRGNRDLFSVNAFGPFCESCKAVLADIRSQSVDRFRCSIRPIRPVPNVIERRFPLHEANRIFRATLPLVNDGPGLALDTVVTVVADSGALFVQNERLAIGTVEPGEFAVTLDLLVGDPAASVVLLVEIRWSTAHSTVREEISFEAHLVAQNPDVPWNELEAADPYSIEVAHGDEFVGRRAKVTALAGRLRRPRMQSSYITGQKRVGKTSLALAVQNHVEDEVGHGECEFIYLEYGEYARSDAAKTVTALGLAIAKELALHLPVSSVEMHDFDASIAPLNQIAQQLIRLHPEKRFIIILDEFDEIHPEMYRFGPLAEAFFSNLRTLSAKQNISLMLVGGENMPFIIGAQGDQLNKFVPEQLSYFSRTSEWEDFVDIVKLKNASSLTWYESSLTEIFRIANGHPYYTKMLCARIYLNAVAGRDTEITVEEVSRAMRMLIDGLDTNAFAHFWKDGIAAERNEAEVAELKRKRVLVAVGQTKRQGVPLTLEAIIANVRALSMSSTEVPPILNDFVRRDILRERANVYSFILPLFEDWLVQKGVGKLIVDTLGDEMAEALRALDDEAYVTATEIAAAISNWPPYMGKERTVGDIQGWLDQRSSLRERRLLFKLVENLRFVREEEVRDKLRIAHSISKQHMGAFTPDNRSQRRFDIAITYIDGPGKSGARFAEKYAEVNLISTTCILERNGISETMLAVEKRRKQTFSGIVVVDDIAATGGTLAVHLETFLTENREMLLSRKIPIVVIALFATEDADQRIRETLAKHSGIDIDFRVCELITRRLMAFDDQNTMWEDVEERDRGKALAIEIGMAVSKKTPLGHGGLGLLMAFTDTVPNNTVPVIHASSNNWNALLPRPKN